MAVSRGSTCTVYSPGGWRLSQPVGCYMKLNPRKTTQGQYLQLQNRANNINNENHFLRTSNNTEKMLRISLTYNRMRLPITSGNSQFPLAKALQSVCFVQKLLSLPDSEINECAGLWNNGTGEDHTEALPPTVPLNRGVTGTHKLYLQNEGHNTKTPL